jgi:hypothetical protein
VPVHLSPLPPTAVGELLTLQRAVHTVVEEPA